MNILRTLKLKGLLSSLLLASALFVLLPFQARAGDTTIQYSTDNLLLGFLQTTGQGATEDYYVDLGPVQNFNFNQNFTILSTGTSGYGSVGTDLMNIFGTDYHSAIDTNTQKTAVLFSLEADSGTTGTGVGSDPKDTLYTTVPDGGTPFTQKSASLQSAGATAIENAGSNGLNGEVSTANSDEGVEQTVGGNAYGTYQPGGTNSPSNNSFKYFTPSNQGQITASLEFERLATGTGAGTDLGTFSIDSSGDLVFITAQSVPEPSVWASMVAGVSVLLVLQRRRRSKST